MLNINQLPTAAGLYFVPIPPIGGKPTKAPRAKGWNLPQSAQNPGGYSQEPNTSGNLGLYHGASNTLALDVDDLAEAERVFDETTGIDLEDWLNDFERLEIRSPKANRGKLLFKLPEGFKNARLQQLRGPNGVIFELRCGNCQDVVFGQHPDGGSYELIGNLAKIPEAPAVLLDMLRHWDEWKPCFNTALGESEPPRIAHTKSQEGEQLPGRRDPIREFNQSVSVSEILTRNGYKPKGRDRFIRPGSESKAPGAVIMRNCSDGIERVYSHGGDILNDSFAHDAFDCYRLLECGGDFNKALSWSPEISRHNQRLFAQERAKNAPPPPQSHDEGKQQAEPRTKPEWQPFPIVPANELTAKPIKIDWLLNGLIERASLNLLFGEPGAGKSLFALDWAFCMAAGLEWHDHKTKPVDVIVVAGEGFSGMARRLKALESKYQMKSPERLFISQRPANLIDGVNAQWVADTIKATCQNPGLVIVDTLHRNMDGDENSSQDIGRFVANLDGFFKPLGAATLVVHHSGHGDKQRSRGSSSIRAAMDAEFSATKDDASITLSCRKSKDFEAFKPMQFKLKPVELDWLDDEGEPMTSVCLAHDGEAKTTTQKRRLSARDDAILSSLSEAIAQHGVTPSGEIQSKFAPPNGQKWAEQKVVNISHWREFAYRCMAVDEKPGEEKLDTKKKAFQRCRNKLFDNKFTIEFGDYAWRIFEVK
ncbi:AAA family ATPase [Methylotuvimicrobium sp. KM2]|uniref:AAA family ATPase n=1 Tax=Methylotuvimicrobium sp. KM2 TaxID=3133976 RepID=UPI003100B3E1